MRRRVLASGCVVAALALAGCGEEETSGAGAELAGLAPAEAVVYAEAVVRPEGEQREEIDAVLGTLLDTDDPGGLILGKLDEGIEEDGSETVFSEDILPALGERAAFFASEFDAASGAGGIYGFMVESTDADALLEAVRESIDEDTQVVERTYAGADYLLEEGVDVGAVGIVDGHLVEGTEDGFKAVVDASSGDSLADSTELPAEFDQLGSEAVAAFYADPVSVLDALEAAGQLPADQREAFEAQPGIGIEEPFAGSLGATASSLFFELSSTPGESTTTPAPELLAELPADAWLAAAAGDFGSALDAGVAGLDAQLESMPAVPPELRGGLEAAASRELGLDVRALASSIGDVALYVRGTSIFGLGGALVVEMSDEAVALEALGPLRDALERSSSVQVQPLDIEGEGFEVTVVGAPVQIPVVIRDGRLVAGLGTESVEEGFESEETLSGSDAFAAAADELGEGVDPAFYFDFEPLVELIESTGQTAGDPGYAEAKPYLDALDFLVFGQALEDGRARLRASLGVDDAGE